MTLVASHRSHFYECARRIFNSCFGPGSRQTLSDKSVAPLEFVHIANWLRTVADPGGADVLSAVAILFHPRERVDRRLLINNLQTG